MNGEDFKRLEQIVFNFKEEVKADFRHQIGIQSENFQHKLDLVVEGHQMLSEKIDGVETRLNRRMDCLEHKLDVVAAKGDVTATKLDAVAARAEETATKLDGVSAKLDAVAAKGEETAAKLDGVSAKLDALATDLKAHRADTEAHRPVYRVKE